MNNTRSFDVLIVGAGVAGLAAAEALSRAGASVGLLDRKPYVGGRAYSYPHPALGEVVDSQHVFVGCCTNLVDLSERSGATEVVRWYDRIPFLEPANSTRGPRLSFLGSGSLPAPAHASGTFLAADMLSLADKAATGRSLLKFLRGYPASDDEPFSTWIAREKPSERAIAHFWKPLVVATLNDSFERSSTRYAGQVFHEIFLKNSTGSRQAIPTVPLSEFYGYFARLAERQGTTLLLRSGAQQIAQADDGRWSVTAGDQVLEAASLVLAIPFDQAAALLRTLPENAPQRERILPHLEHFLFAPYTTVHLWFDSAISDLDQAGLLDAGADWMFNKTRIRGGDPSQPQYYEISIAASFAQLRQSREEILAATMNELPRFFPAVKNARLLKAGVLKEARATFSVLPGLDIHRPHPSDPRGGLFLAGDWTRTGWPSTMEGAARSGRLAAEAVTAALGRSQTFLSPDLAPSGFMRWLA